MLFRLLLAVWEGQHLWASKQAEMKAKPRKSRLFHLMSRLCGTSGARDMQAVDARLNLLGLAALKLSRMQSLKEHLELTGYWNRYYIGGKRSLGVWGKVIS